MGHNGEVWEPGEEVGELLALALGPLHCAALSELLLGQAMGVDGTIGRFHLWPEVLYPFIYRFSFFISDSCILYEFVMFEAISFRIQCVEVSLLFFLQSLLSSFKIPSLSLIFLLIHIRIS